METEVKLKDMTVGAIAEIPRYRADIDDVRKEIKRLRRNEVSEDDFKKYRLQRGIYGQRQKPDIQMVRVKIPWGQLTAEQLDALAEIADDFPGEDRVGIAHVTTRQDIQFHFVKLDRIPECMSRLADAGLTTREACANTVRNVTADPLAGVAQDEVFDVSPYAEAAARFFLRHPVCQNLPRKFKICFSGSVADRGLIPMHDLGCLAVSKSFNGKETHGFKIYVGGGLGPNPKLAFLIEDFTPLDQFLRTAHAVIAVFNRDWDYGRKNRNMARIKFLIEKIGFEEFRKRVLTERESLQSETYPAVVLFKEEVPNLSGPFLVEMKTPEYLRWKSTNVLAQKHRGYNIVTLALPLGDITSSQLRALSEIVRKYSNGLVRTTVQQNIVIRWVMDEALYSIYTELSKAGLALPSADRLADITCCPGGDTCQLGITSSRGLATALGKMFRNGRSADADLKDIQIKISGCPNSCGQHHLADIGFYGGSKAYGEHQVPTYTMLLGGHLELEKSAYGKQFLRVPAKKVPAVVGKLLDLYKSQKKENEKFREFVNRAGYDALRKELEPVTLLPETPESEFYSDWGTGEEFKLQVGKGECAA